MSILLSNEICFGSFVSSNYLPYIAITEFSKHTGAPAINLLVFAYNNSVIASTSEVLNRLVSEILNRQRRLDVVKGTMTTLSFVEMSSTASP